MTRTLFRPSWIRTPAWREKPSRKALRRARGNGSGYRIRRSTSAAWSAASASSSDFLLVGGENLGCPPKDATEDGLDVLILRGGRDTKRAGPSSSSSKIPSGVKVWDGASRAGPR
jgi:hypothetical protein